LGVLTKFFVAVSGPSQVPRVRSPDECQVTRASEVVGAPVLISSLADRAGR
jgi:hypothetical protein